MVERSSAAGLKRQPSQETPVQRQGTLGRVGKIVLVPIPSIPKQNCCVYLGPRSAIETEVEFKAFFDQDHTVAGWFMPQYALGAGHGPLFASSGAGYFIGQGDYRSGDALVTAMRLAPGVAPKAGAPVLTAITGSESRLYLAPSWKTGVWQHLAVVRKSSLIGNTVMLYLNGQKLHPVSVTTNTVGVKQPNGTTVQMPSSKTVSPTSDLRIPASMTGASLGKLVLGRALHPTTKGAYAQAYGLLDDVAVFDHALTQAEINDLVSKKRLSGYEVGLVAGWGFDTPLAGSVLPSKLAGTLTEQHVDPNLKVSADRNSSADVWMFDNPFLIAATTPIVNFPFAAGDAWKVIQGYCNPLTSHDGDIAAFCYDLHRPTGSSGNAPVHAVESGVVYRYLNDPNPKATKEANTVDLFNEAVDLGVTYMHLADNSLVGAVIDGDPPPADPTKYVTLWPGVQRNISSGQHIGDVGPLGQHLHLAGWESFVDGVSVQMAPGTIPIAFENVEVMKSGESNWFPPLGPYLPKEGDQLRTKG